MSELSTPTYVAQYLRMSTEHQRYSLRNQATIIAAYAASRGYLIVQSYVDEGRSGLTLAGRRGLQKLLTDILGREVNFSKVLVLDVSRWGRFQDPDEAAHYEYVCKDAGIVVDYCGEEFESGPGAMNALIKNIKRIMAAEFSRELSNKIKFAQLQQANIGFKMGGMAPYGFRRVVACADGRPGLVLGPGQSKALKSDRVIFAHGPRAELDTIRQIFSLYVNDGLWLSAIARRLKRRKGISTTRSPWSSHNVKHVLKNELVLGTYVYNRSSRLLKKKKIDNPSDEWVRVKVLPPLIDEELFEKAQVIMREGPRRHLPDQQLIEALRVAIAERGYISEKLIAEHPNLPDPKLYRSRFGSIKRAYELAGFSRCRPPPKRPCIWSEKALLTPLRALFKKHGWLSSLLIEADPACACVATYINRFGSLFQAYKRVGFSVTAAEVRSNASRRASASQAAQDRLQSKDNAILERLRPVVARHSKLTHRILCSEPGAPTRATLVRHFGSLAAAYELASAL